MYNAKIKRIKYLPFRYKVLYTDIAYMPFETNRTNKAHSSCVVRVQTKSFVLSKCSNVKNDKITMGPVERDVDCSRQA